MAKLQRDFTSGNIVRHLLVFAVPILISNLLQSMYNLADTLIISRYLGEAGLATINSGSQIMTVLINVITGLCLGASVTVGQYFGSGDKERLKRNIGTVFLLVSLFAILLTLLFLVGAPYFLRVLQTPEQVWDKATVFLQIYSIAIPFLFASNAIFAVLRGIGNSKAALVFILLSTICNLILDILFVIVFRWGTAGAAAATTISISLCFLLSLGYFMKQTELFQFRRPNFRFDKELAGRFLWIGFPSALQQSIFGLSMLVMTRFVNGYGVTAAAVLGIGLKIEHFSVQPTHAISNAETSMIAQNLGAGQVDRTKTIVKTAVAYQVGVACLLLCIIQLFAPAIIGIFTDSQDLIELGILYLRLVSFDGIFVACVRGFNALAVGSGNAIFPLLTTIMNGFVFRVPIALFCERILGLGLTGIFLGLALANLGGATAGFLYYKSGHWAKRVKASEQAG